MPNYYIILNLVLFSYTPGVLFLELLLLACVIRDKKNQLSKTVKVYNVHINYVLTIPLLHLWQ